jgi:hypothetical protein
MKTKATLFATVLALALPTAHASTLIYNLNGSYAATNPHGPSLVPYGGTLGSTGYYFGVNEGLGLSGTGAFDSFGAPAAR